MSVYDENNRRALRSLMLRNGVRHDRAHIIVDLACLAAERSVDIVFEIVGRAPDDGAKMMALEVATQLASARLTGVFERAHALGKAAGCPQYEGSAEIPA